MKKLMILLAVACLIFVSCGNREKATEPQAEETCCTLTPEQQAMFENWENWDALTEEDQVALVDEVKAFFDECHAKCEAECKEAKEEGAETECPEKAAKCAEFKARWEAFETFTLAEKKEILDQKIECAKAKCCKEKETCQKEEETIEE